MMKISSLIILLLTATLTYSKKITCPKLLCVMHKEVAKAPKMHL